MVGECRLCGQQKKLCNSHIIPGFVGKWIKETSVTGYLRQAVNPNVRRQDMFKEYLFCENCEKLFCETEFSSKVFYPYVNHELDKWGRAKGELKTIDYTEWLLRFVISVQFRQLITISPEEEKELGHEQVSILRNLIPTWKNYLLYKSSDTGSNRSYLLFLQNLVFGSGNIQRKFPPRVNLYLLRSVDMTTITSNKRLGLYTKLGPMVLFTTIIPDRITVMESVVIRKKGTMYTAQNLKDRTLNEFIFFNRPKLALPRNIELDEKSKKMIEKSYMKNIEKVGDNMVTLANISDDILSREGEEFEDDDKRKAYF